MPTRSTLLLAILAASLLSVACASVGPRALKGNRTDYNQSINASNNEEMLLNIVRIHHLDAPFFLNVSSVSSSFNLGVSAGFDVKFNAGPIEGYRGQYPYSAATPSVGAQYSESPTVVYVPLSGERFATQLLTEISLERLLFLARAGWNMELLLRVLAKRIGPCANPSGAMDSTLDQDPERTRAFERLAALLGRMQARGDLELHARPDAQGQAAAMQLRFAAREELQELEGLLGLRLPGGYPTALLRLSQTNDLQADHACDGATCRVFVRLRNFIGILDALSQGVEAPGEPSGARGAPPVPFRIRAGAQAPADAFVAARYEGRWYSIARQDQASRKVLSFLEQLFALEGGELPKTTPLLTLPVNR